MRLQQLKDVNGSTYIGIDLPATSVSKYIEVLDRELGKEDAEAFVENLLRRNGDRFHCTVFNVMECGKMGSACVGDILESTKEYQVSMLGIGRGENSDKDVTYFIVCESPQIDELRLDYGFAPKDLHVTLAFSKKDIFNIDKSKVLWKV